MSQILHGRKNPEKGLKISITYFATHRRMSLLDTPGTTFDTRQTPYKYQSSVSMYSIPSASCISHGTRSTQYLAHSVRIIHHNTAKIPNTHHCTIADQRCSAPPKSHGAGARVWNKYMKMYNGNIEIRLSNQIFIYHGAFPIAISTAQENSSIEYPNNEANRNLMFPFICLWTFADCLIAS